MTGDAGEYYLEAWREAVDAARALTRGRGVFRTRDGVVLHVNFRTPLRIFTLIVARRLPGQEQATRFTFQRDGRVTLGGDRRVPLREAMSRGHEPWASRADVLELAAQLGDAKQWRDA
jgi:hypothetical protein